MRLIFLPANQAFVFMFFNAMCRLANESNSSEGGFPMFFETRKYASDVANACGLQVNDDDTVTLRNAAMMNSKP